MAAGDFLVFDQFLVDVQEGLHDLENDTIKLGLVTASVTPAVTTSDGRWGAGGSTNFTTNQVTPGGNYSSGGPTVANPTVTLTGGAAVFDGGDITINQNGSNPTNARWGILYNDTDAGKRAIGYLDLGAATDLTSGDFVVSWSASGIHSFNQA